MKRIDELSTQDRIKIIECIDEILAKEDKYITIKDVEKLNQTIEMVTTS